jgi:hypothetical protein
MIFLMNTSKYNCIKTEGNICKVQCDAIIYNCSSFLHASIIVRSSGNIHKWMKLSGIAAHHISM